MSDAPTFRCAGCGIVYSTQENASRCARGDVIRQCDCGECDECYRRRIATLEARIATVADEAFGPFPVQTVDEALTAIERGIFEMRQAAEARIAELERERDAAKADAAGWMKVYGNQIKTSAGLALERNAARADLDEAVRLLRWWFARDGHPPVKMTEMFLARHTTPDKETT